MTPIKIPIHISLFVICIFTFEISFSQVAINTTSSKPDSSAMLDVQSTNKGMLIPRMSTSQLQAIQNPAEGLMVYDIDKKKITTYSNRQGWEVLDTETPGRFFISDHHPDTLYPETDYEYYGTENGGVFERYMDTFPGEWVTKSPTGRIYLSNDPVASSLESYRQLLYTGTSSNKILRIGNDYNYVNSNEDSAVIVYNLTTDSVYKDPLIKINRTGGFTATIDTSNSRIFVWGGRPVYTYTSSNPNPYFPFDEGFIYYYNTGQKVAMDSTTAPPTYRRYDHTAVWAKSVNKLLVFGGYSMTSNFPEANGGVRDSNLYAYNPVLNNWSILTPCPLPPRARHLAVYDGNDQMIIWGGGNYYNNYYDGAIYTISTNTWRMMSNVNRPDTLMYCASWTGSEMIVSNTGRPQCCKPFKAFRYNPLTDTWATIPGIPSDTATTRNQNHTYDALNKRLCVLRDYWPDNPVLWSYSFMNNTWSPLRTNNTAYSYRNAVYGYKAVQADSETIFSTTSNAPYYQRYVPAHFSPGLVAFSVKWHYYRKK